MDYGKLGGKKTFLKKAYFMVKTSVMLVSVTSFMVKKMMDLQMDSSIIGKNAALTVLSLFEMLDRTSLKVRNIWPQLYR